MTALARVLLLVTLAASPLTSQAISVRTISEFGGAQDDPAAEMLQVSSVVRTDDGRYVVANGKPLEVRVYDASGQMQRRLGRAGEGPGELRYQAMVRHWPGDSVLAFSSGTNRWMLFSLDGKLVREWRLGASDPHPGQVQLLGGAFVTNQLGTGAACRAEQFRRLAPVGGPAHEGMVDGAGRVWLRRADADQWRVYAANGSLVGGFSIPRFTPTEFRGRNLVGFRLDEDDFPHVIAVDVALPAGASAPTDCPASTPNTARLGDLKATIRNAMTAAERYYADHGRYPRSMAEYGSLLKLDPGIQAQVEMAAPNGNGYAVSAWETATGARCLVSVGNGLRNYPDGVIGCGG